MPRKNKDGKDSSRKKGAKASPDKNMPEKLSHGSRYEGFDEDRSTFNPAHGSDYDVDENDIDRRSGEYRDYGGSGRE